MSPISRSTPLDQLGKKCSNFFLVNGPIEPLIKITLVPCWTDPESHFALVVAVSHLIADGHTFYQLHHMLCGSEIFPLKVKRIEASASQQAAAMGTQNYSYFALPGLGFIVNSTFGFWRGKTIGPPNQTVFALVDKERMTVEKERVRANHEGVSFVSTNDVLTSWFLQKSGCSLGVMSINWRNRLAGHTDQHAGNYESGIFYRSSDSVSAALIRLSLMQGFERTKTFAQALPGFFEMVSTTTMAIVTNWASFAKVPNLIEGCQEELHLPLYDAVIPTSFALLIVFRAGPDRLGLCMVGTPGKLRGLRDTPSLAKEQFI